MTIRSGWLHKRISLIPLLIGMLLFLGLIIPMSAKSPATTSDNQEIEVLKTKITLVEKQIANLQAKIESETYQTQKQRSTPLGQRVTNVEAKVTVIEKGLEEIVRNLR